MRTRRSAPSPSSCRRESQPRADLRPRGRRAAHARATARAAARRRPAAVAQGRARGAARGDGGARHHRAQRAHLEVAARGHAGGRDRHRRHDPDRLLLAAVLAGVPSALGAKVAQPDRPVVAICGDGGFMYNAQEMSTAVKYGINVVAVVFNDEAYGNVARDLDEAWGGAWEADFRNPDFMKLADVYGVAALTTEKPTEVGDLVRRAI